MQIILLSLLVAGATAFPLANFTLTVDMVNKMIDELKKQSRRSFETPFSWNLHSAKPSPGGHCTLNERCLNRALQSSDYWARGIVVLSVSTVTMPQTGICHHADYSLAVLEKLWNPVLKWSYSEPKTEKKNRKLSSSRKKSVGALTKARSHLKSLGVPKRREKVSPSPG